MSSYPSYICKECAVSGGGKIPSGHIACFHMGICPCCAEMKALTQPRDYGYPKIKHKDKIFIK